ncbi:MAG: hypothetical protein EOP53_07010 [Sphingobacteriales bacterium]|nr:MAG: hypothetical protein EOP53_07010 [Sphingobacteriales bacterium]
MLEVILKSILLKEFCLTGRFGEVEISMAISDVKRILGKPDHEQDYNSGSSGIMYAWYEFFYWTDSQILYAIQNDHLTSFTNLKGKDNIKAHKNDITFKNKKFYLDIWFLNPGKDITYKEVVEYLLTDNIKFKEIEDEYEGFIIEFESGVRLDFDDRSGWFYENNDEQILANQNIIKNKEEQLLNGMRLFRL